MAKGHDPGDRRSAREKQRDSEEQTTREREEEEAAERHPQAELRWVQLREPRHAIEIGQNGRILASYFHEGYDSWEVLLETYEGELSE